MLTNVLIGNAGAQAGLGQIVNYFNVRSSMTDVSTAMGITNFLMSAAILIVSVLGFIALAIWVLRIGVDILLITLRGTSIADKLRKFGTNDDKGSYDKVSTYLQKNMVEIILVVVLVALMVTGWLWRIFAFALQGVGGMLNFLLGLDFNGMMSSTDFNAWKENIGQKRPEAIRNEYDEYSGRAASTLEQLYGMTDVDNTNPEKQNLIRQYTIALYQAEHIGTTYGNQLATTLKTDANYFKRHQNACAKGYLDSNAAQGVKSVLGVGEITCKAGISGAGN